MKFQGHASVPARIHHSLLDSRSASLEAPGGGGISFTVNDVVSECGVSLRPQRGAVFEGDRSPAVEFILDLLSKTVGYDGGFALRVTSHGICHRGLASSAGAILAGVLAANEALGQPLTARQIRRLIGYNFVENEADGGVRRGFETGCAAVAALYGGLNVVGNDLEIIDHMDLPEEYYVVVFIPHAYSNELVEAGSIPATWGAGEMSTIAYNREQDLAQLPLKAYKVLFELIPRMRARDLPGVARVLHDLNFLCTPLGSITRRFSSIYYHYFESLRLLGADFVGLSSAGPAFYATSPDRAVLTRCREYITSRCASPLHAVISPAGGRAAIVGAGDRWSYSIPGLAGF